MKYQREITEAIKTAPAETLEALAAYLRKQAAMAQNKLENEALCSGHFFTGEARSLYSAATRGAQHYLILLQQDEGATTPRGRDLIWLAVRDWTATFGVQDIGDDLMAGRTAKIAGLLGVAGADI